jgi:hypothetical protein
MRWRLLLLILLLPSLLAAAPPNTLAYQANLADASGQAITGTRNIVFRLYDVPTGGTALWTESQTNVLIDGGNLAVELGLITPLPRSAFGRQLYLGVEIQGDSEMTPRPPLTSAPYAQRAAGLFRQRFEVPADGTPVENGTALLALLAGLPAATANAPIVVQLDAGVFDLGPNPLLLPSFVTLRGQGAGNVLGANPQTTIVGEVPAGSVMLMQANTSAHDLAVRNIGASTVETLPPTSAIAAHAAGDPLSPVDSITLSRVAASATAPGNSGTRSGAYICANGGRLEHSRFEGSNGNLTHGLRASCPAAESLFIQGILAAAQSNGATVRGIELATGGLWDDSFVFIDSVSASNISVIGILVLDNDNDSGALLRKAGVTIQGNNVENNSAGSVAGIWVQGADVGIDSPIVTIEDLRYNARGIRITVTGSDDDYAPISDPHIMIDTAGTGSGVGSGFGILFEGAGQAISGGSVRIVCNNGAPCFGIAGGPGSDGSVQPRMPVITGVDVEVINLSATANAQAGRFQEPVNLSNSRFSAQGGLPGTARAVALSDLANSAGGRTHELSLNRLESDNGCAIGYSTAAGETLGLRLTGNSTTGIVCQGQALGTPTLRCAGNTRRNGDGSVDFLSNACP